MNQEQTALHTASGKFAKGLQTLHAQNCSFTACVRIEYEQIEKAIKAGISLEKIARLLCDSYGTNGSLSALKSALRRIRLANGGYAQQKWLDDNAPLPPARSNGGSMADWPTTNSQQGPQPYRGGGDQMPMYMPNAGFRQSPPLAPHSSSAFPQPGQEPHWQSRAANFDSGRYRPSI